MKSIHTIFLFTALTVCFQLASAANEKQQHTVTFNVNMESAEGFDPEQHNVILTGSFTGWAEPGTAGSLEMTLVEKNDNGLVYTVTAEIPAGHNEYKYFSDAFGAGWAGGEWPGDPNRVIMVTGNTVINNIWGVIDEEELYTVSFDVLNEAGDAIDDAIITLNNVEFDPGTYVFENISQGSYNYAVARDGYITHHDQFDVVDDDVHVVVVLTEGETPLFEIVFLVNMHEAAAGNVDFDPDIHDVYLTGTFSNWTMPGEDEAYMMQAIEGFDNWYALSLELETGTYEYKYFLVENEATWELGEWTGSADRVIPANSNMPVFNLFGTPETHSVVFSVFDEENNEINDAVITIILVENNPGEYTYAYVAPGEYEFSVAKEGYITHHDVFEVVDDDLLVHVELITEEEPAYVVSFFITDDEGVEITDAVITLAEHTNAAGDYVFEDILPGSYDFHVAKEGFEDYFGYVVVTTEDVIVEVTMDAIETSSLSPGTPKIVVFPNPVDTKLNIRTFGETILDITLVDMIGHVVYEAIIMDNRHEISVSGLKNGVYFIRINTQNALTTKMIIVSN